jgi:hypothetical protein
MQPSHLLELLEWFNEVQGEHYVTIPLNYLHVGDADYMLNFVDSRTADLVSRP